jgi:hypothetical protein
LHQTLYPFRQTPQAISPLPVATENWQHISVPMSAVIKRSALGGS